MSISRLPKARRGAIGFGPIAALGVVVLGAASFASSHREAPFITEHPKVDATDLYAFTSYEPGREDFVTLIANYYPAQVPAGGPNFYTLDHDAFYDIRIDNNGDAIEDITFRFEFMNRLRNIEIPVGDPGNERLISVPLKNIGQISAMDTTNLNIVESYQVSVITGPVTAPTSVSQLTHAGNPSDSIFEKPADNIGNKSIPDYGSYSAAFIHDVQIATGVPGRLFVGQRQDPFFIALGETFDLLNFNPLGPVDAKVNTFDDLNVTALTLEVPKSFLSGTSAQVIGIWTTASLPRVRALESQPGFYDVASNSIEMQQVSRLGMPLVNELVIGLKDKNLFNASEPKDDAQFADYVGFPTLPELIQTLFPVIAPNLFPRMDLQQAFLTGIPGLNANNSGAEMLRLNMALAPVAARNQSPLGVLAGDNAGYPNGRRPGDDIVDITLRVVMGVLLDATVAPDGQLPYTDQVRKTALDFPTTFPYLNVALKGSPQ